MGCCWSGFWGPDEGLTDRLLQDPRREHLETLYSLRQQASYRLGSCQEAHDFCECLLQTPHDSFRGKGKEEEKDKLANEAIRMVELAIQAEASMGGSKWRNILYFDKAEVLFWAGRVEEAFEEYKSCLKDQIEPRIVDSYFPKLVALERENEVDKICRDIYPRAKNKEEQELLLRAFYQYTTLSHKAAYEWADPQDVDQFVAEQQLHGIIRETMRKKKLSQYQQVSFAEQLEEEEEREKEEIEKKKARGRK
jgi:hypothetical protein